MCDCNGTTSYWIYESGISYRLSERIAFLLSDDVVWVQYYKKNILNLNDNDEITSEFISQHLKDSRMKLNEIMSEFYRKRSKITHEGDRKITEEDYRLVKLLLLQTVVHMFDLLANGMDCIVGSTSKSLEYTINALKFN